jgi:hypothetical protein
MNWLVVVMFATLAGDLYVFTEPSFSTREECMSRLTDPASIEKMTRKLLEEYGRVMPIHLVNCIEEQEFKKILEDHKNRTST